ncbi:hypothetical protein N0V88_006959 [Collariella sp. IMI 366227]|nr:hypothetical protein N0V88_006959 [Collariella sp. IMI 366227]
MHSPQPFATGRQTHYPPQVWQEGDVAFLTSYDTFPPSLHKELIQSGYLPQKATTRHVLITPVSAYRHTQTGLPPWQQHCHWGKNPLHFRAFAGTARFDASRPPLHLVPGQRWPKPNASWVYIDQLFVVPLAVLGTFSKGGVRDLRMAPNNTLPESAHFLSPCSAQYGPPSVYAAATTAMSRENDAPEAVRIEAAYKEVVHHHPPQPEPGVYYQPYNQHGGPHHGIESTGSHAGMCLMQPPGPPTPSASACPPIQLGNVNVDLNCPEIDGTRERFDGKYTFQYRCGMDISGAQYDLIFLASYALGDCVRACMSYNNQRRRNECIAVQFNADMKACALKNETNDAPSAVKPANRRVLAMLEL